MSVAYLQRAAKRQPGAGLMGLVSSPFKISRLMGLWMSTDGMADSIAPHSGVGACTPRPMKERPAAVRIRLATFMDAATMEGEMRWAARARRSCASWDS